MMSFDGLPRGRELAVMHERSTLVVEAPQLARDEFAVPREEAWRSSRLILVERFTLGVGRRITCGADVMQLEIGVSFDQNRPVVRSQARKRQHTAGQVHGKRRSADWIVRGSKLQVRIG